MYQQMQAQMQEHAAHRRNPALLHNPRSIQLLAALPKAEWERWLPQLEHVDLPLGTVLYESGAKLTHVYFPTTAIVSLPYMLESGASAEIAIVGNEGLLHQKRARRFCERTVGAGRA